MESKYKLFPKMHILNPHLQYTFRPVITSDGEILKPVITCTDWRYHGFDLKNIEISLKDENG